MRRTRRLPLSVATLTLRAASSAVMLVAVALSLSMVTTSAPAPALARTAGAERLLATVHDFGWRVAMSGSTLVVGVPNVGPGLAYVYVRGPSGWPTTPTDVLNAPAAATNGFGASVAP